MVPTPSKCDKHILFFLTSPSLAPTATRFKGLPWHVHHVLLLRNFIRKVRSSSVQTRIQCLPFRLINSAIRSLLSASLSIGLHLRRTWSLPHLTCLPLLLPFPSSSAGRCQLEHAFALAIIHAKLAMCCPHLQEGLSVAWRTHTAHQQHAPASRELWQTREGNLLHVSPHS